MSAGRMIQAVRRLRYRARSILWRLREQTERARTERLLSSLDEHQLKDIGFPRYDDRRYTYHDAPISRRERRRTYLD